MKIALCPCRTLLAMLVTAAPMLRAAPAIPNPSFEQNGAAFTVSPGYVSGNTAITSWNGSDSSRLGLNSSAGPFFDNGAVPQGSYVAFVQSVGPPVSLATTISGLTIGVTYRVQFQANRRASYGIPRPTVTLNNGTPLSFSVDPALDVYRMITGVFTATASTAPLVIINTPDPSGFQDATVMLDNFSIDVAVPTTFMVTNTLDDGAGSLRQAMRDAAALAGPDIIAFDPVLNGSLITLLSEIGVSDTDGVTVDASNLPQGMNLSGGNTNRVFDVKSGGKLILKNLWLTSGSATTAPLNTSRGGVLNNFGTLTLINCSLTGNAANDSGGAISNPSGILVLTNCTLSNNTAANSGGAIASTGALTINGCTFDGNTATNAGGAIDNLSTTTLTITRSTFTNNQAGTAGGAISDGGGNTGNGNNAGNQMMAITRCTIAGNRSLASGSGGGLSLSGTTQTTFLSTILASNTANGALRNYGSTGTAPTLTANSYNLSDDTPKGFSGTDIVNSGTIGLAPLANNGGPTKTMAISSASSAFNAGVGSAPVQDQRGCPVVDVPDIGAFEVQTTVFSLSSSAYTAVAGYPLTVTINRSQGITGAATVRLVTSTATGAFTPRLDVAASDVTFGDGDTSKDVVIGITKSTTTADKTFTITLSQPTPADLASIEGSPSATVTIKSPATLQVTTINDDGPGSLRQALATAATTPAYNLITFAPALNGKTITLGSEIAVNDAVGVTLDATALAAGLVIDAGPGGNRIFTVGSTTDTSLTLLHLTLTHAQGSSSVYASGSGGAIFNWDGSRLQMVRCNLSGCSGVYGAAIDNHGLLASTQCTFSNNTAGQDGGAIYSYGGVVTLSQCTFSGNMATHGGGAISVTVGCAAMITQCTFFRNTAGTEGGGIKIAGGTTGLTLAQCTMTHNAATGVAAGNSGGGGIVSSGILTLDRSIIAGNSAANGPKDVACGDLTLSGTNLLQDILVNGSTSGAGKILNANPGLDTLASNGGPTQTVALFPGSAALNAAMGSTFTTDQRGLPIVNTPDIGAFEMQTGGVFTMDHSSYSVMEGDGGVDVTIARNGAFLGEASVTLSTVAGTAGKADFTGVSRVVHFVDGQDFATVTIPILNDSLVEADESFTVTLSKPSAGCTLGYPASCTVVIIDPSTASDITKPSAPTFISPAANAMVGVPTGGTLTFMGTATDNKGVGAVGIYNSAGISQLAYLNAVPATTTTWAALVTPVTGLNTYRVICADAEGNLSDPTTRTFIVLRPLVVSIAGYGTVTAGYAPSSYRQVGKPVTITATPGAGYLFSGWSILSTHTPGELAISTDALLQPTLTFMDREGLILRASFVPNPYTTGVAGVFNGGIDPSTTLPNRAPVATIGPEDGTAASLSSVGYASFTVQSNGAFTGALKLDGTSYAVPGAFDAVGTARFGVNRVTTFNIVRKGQPDLFVTLNIDVGVSTISGVVSAFDGSTTTAVSILSAERCPFGTGHLVDPSLLAASNADAVYTTLLSPTSNAGFATTDYPQSAGYASVKLTKLGAVTVTGVLPDGTALSCATTLSGVQHWRLFASLYGAKGLVAGNVVFNLSGNYDFSALSTRWLRPVMDAQYYPGGWAAGILINVGGAKYTVTPGVSVLPALDVGGDAELAFSYGGLTGVLDDALKLSSADIATNSGNDPSYKLTINRQTGVFSGFFTHSDGSKPTFNGVVLTKSASTVSAGFFLTPALKVKDYTGQSGSVILEATP